MYNVTIRLTDGGSPSNSFDQEIMVILTNGRDSRPKIPQEFKELEIDLPEDHPVGISNPFASFRVTNADDVPDTVVYSISSVQPGSPGNITVNSVNGDLYLNGSLNFDDFSNLRTLRFTVEASSSITGSDNAFVTVRVTDVNDNAPFLSCLSSQLNNTIPCPDPASPFTQLTVTFTNASNLTAQHVLTLQGEDDDRTAENSAFEISISSLPAVGAAFNQFGPFFLLGINPCLLVSNVTIPISIRNTACPQMSSSATVDIIMPQDLNREQCN